MYCRVCGAEIADNAKFCSECGANLTVDHHDDKVTVEEKPPVLEEKPRLTKAERAAIRKKKSENTKKLLEEDKHKKEKIKSIKQENENKYVMIGFVLSSISMLAILVPVGVEYILSWWYSALVMLIGVYALYYAKKARTINDELFKQYQIKIHPKLVTCSFVFCFISVFVAFYLFIGVVF